MAQKPPTVPTSYRPYSGIEESPEMVADSRLAGVRPDPMVDTRLNALLTKALMKKKSAKPRKI